MPVRISVDPRVQARLKKYGEPGMSYDDILTRLMDAVDRRNFVAEMRGIAAATRSWVDLDDV